MEDAVADSAWPGAVLVAGSSDEILYKNSFGFHTYEKAVPTQVTDIFDLASISKVVGTTSAVMKLYEEGFIDLDDPVREFIPEFRKGDKRDITIRHLLTHTAGLPPFKQFYLMDGDPQDRLKAVLDSEIVYSPGDSTVYSDIGFITLGKLVEKVSRTTLDDYLTQNIFRPAGMYRTMYFPIYPDSILLSRIVPTEISAITSELIHGYVHDENSHSMGGVTGHAGLFSTADDLYRYSKMMLRGGESGRTSVFLPETIDLFTRRANVREGSSRCLGWDSPSGLASGGVYLSDKSFGHTGYTGTSMWIDPENDVIVILLTNAVHPNRSWKSPKYYDWRQRIHSAVYESLGFEKQNPNLKWRNRWAKEP